MNEQNINLTKSTNPVEGPKEIKSKDCKDQSDFDVEIVHVPKSETDDVILVDNVKTEDCDTSERLMKDLKALGNCIAPAKAYLMCRKRESVQGESSTSKQAHANRPKSEVLLDKAKKKVPRMTWSLHALIPDHIRKYKRFIAEGINEEDARTLSLKHIREYQKYKKALKKKNTEPKPDVLNLETETPEVIVIDDDEEIASNVYIFTPAPQIGIKNKEPMSEDQQEMVKRSIIEAITEITEVGTGPSFHKCLFKDGWIYIICENDHSRDWIVNLIENVKLKPWPDAMLSIITEDQLPMPRIGTVFVPNSEATTVDQFKKMLETQNKDLNTSKWEVCKKTDTPKGMALAIKLDTQSVETLRSLKCMPSLGFGKVKFNIHKTQLVNLDGNDENENKSISTNAPDLCVPSTSQSHNDETVREYADEEQNTLLESSEDPEQEPQENSQEAYRAAITSPDQPPTQQPEHEDWTEASNSGVDWDVPIEPDQKETATDKSMPQESGDRKRENLRNNLRKQPQNVKKQKPLTEPPEYENWSDSSNSRVDWDVPIEPDQKETATDKSMPQESGDRKRDNLRNNLRKQNVKKQKPLTEPPEYENWSDSSNSRVEWDDPIEPDPRELARDDRFSTPSESGKREKQSQNDREKTSHWDTQTPSKSGPTTPRFRDDSRNDRRQHQNVKRKSSRWDTERDLDKERLQRNPRHQYGKDLRDQTLRRGMQTQESMQEREQRPSGSSSQVIWSVGPIRKDTVNPIAMQTPERLSNPSHISWTIDPTGNSQCWTSPMQSEQHTMRALQLNPYNTFRSISTTITNMPEFWIPPPTLGNPQFWSPPQHIERDATGPMRNFPVDSRAESNNPIRSRDILEDYRRNRFPPVWQ